MSKTLVAYFSVGGVTADAAKKIAEAFAMLHKGRPNESDEKAAADFARKITA